MSFFISQQVNERFSNKFKQQLFFLCLNKQIVKKVFMIYVLHTDNLYTFQIANTILNMIQSLKKHFLNL